jgi:hypothetical protein
VQTLQRITPPASPFAWRGQRKEDDTSHAPEWLFIVHAVLYLAGGQKSRMVDHALIVMCEGAREKLLVPDFALDRHTAPEKGRKTRAALLLREGA